MSTKPALLPSSLTPAAAEKLDIQSDWKTAACTLISDAFALAFVFGLLALPRYWFSAAHRFGAGLELLPCLAIVLVAFWAHGLYPGVLRHPAEEMRRIYTAVSVVFLGMTSTMLFWRRVEDYSHTALLLTWLAAPPAVLLSRYVLRRSLAAKAWWGVGAVVLGSGPTAQRVLSFLRDGMLGVRVTGVLPSERMLAWSYESPGTISEKWVQSLELQSRPAQYVIVAVPERLATELGHAIQFYCKGFSHVIVIPDVPGLCTLGLSALDLGGAVGIEMPQRLFHRGAATAKRVMDMTLGILILLLASPLLLAIILAIKLTSKGPVFYPHVRVGRHGDTFQALKFRTMVANADEVLREHLATNLEAEIEWRRNHKLKDDPRVVPVGKLLRRFSLDELPQIWNVLKGQMSLVGPRPIVESEIERYGRRYAFYARVRPGITGLWQVSGRNNTTYEERISFDEYYVRNWSCWLDAYVLVCTVKAVITADGAY